MVVDKKVRIKEKYNSDALQSRISSEIAGFKQNTTMINQQIESINRANINNFDEEVLPVALEQFLQLTHDQLSAGRQPNFHNQAVAFKDEQLYNQRFHDLCRNFYCSAETLTDRHFSLENSAKIRDMLKEDISQIKNKRAAYNQKVMEEVEKMYDYKWEKYRALPPIASPKKKNAHTQRDRASEDQAPAASNKKSSTLESILKNRKASVQPAELKKSLFRLERSRSLSALSVGLLHKKQPGQQQFQQLIQRKLQAGGGCSENGAAVKYDIYKDVYDKIFNKCLREKRQSNRLLWGIQKQKRTLLRTYKSLQKEIQHIV